MQLYHREIIITLSAEENPSLIGFKREIIAHLLPGEIPVRFAITKTIDKSYHCDVDVVNEIEDRLDDCNNFNIFTYSPRKFEDTSEFIAVLLIPTGIGAEIGGHAGDGGALAKFMASSCDKLITHPNVVNASDINDLPDNGLYVEGSVISELMMGNLALQEVRANRILLITEPREDKNITDMSVNTVSAVRASIGIDCIGIAELPNSLKMEHSYSESGCAIGNVDHLETLFDMINHYRGQYDAVALHTRVNVSSSICNEYFRSGGKMVNPWGGVEAMLTHLLALTLGVPVAHAPMVMSIEEATASFGIVDPRISAEVVSACFLICVLKGLHKSPRIIRDLSLIGQSELISSSDISCLIIPDGCVGIPTLAALEQGIPVIAVRENRNQMRNDLTDYPFESGKLFIVDNYLEAAGVMNALRAGVTVDSVRRPLSSTTILNYHV